MLITEPKLAWLAGRYFAFVEAAGVASARRRQSDVALNQAREALYAELKPLLRRHGYDEQTCTRLELSAGLGPEGHFALTIAWHRNPALVESGEVLPTPTQAVPTPVWNPGYVLYRRQSAEAEIPIIVSDPLLVLLLNIHGWLQSARDDVMRLHARGNSAAQWRFLEQGVRRMEERLAQALSEWAPPVPPTLECLLATSEGSPADFSPALRDPRNARLAAYQIVTNVLLDAIEQATAGSLRPKARIALIAERIAGEQRRILSVLQAAARRVQGEGAADLAPLRWRPTVDQTPA